MLENQPPSIDTAALYEGINETHAGTLEDPIPYTQPMEIFKDKYYTQNGVLYKCTRDSGIALSHDLSALVGTYVETVVAASTMSLNAKATTTASKTKKASTKSATSNLDKNYWNL